MPEAVPGYRGDPAADDPVTRRESDESVRAAEQADRAGAPDRGAALDRMIDAARDLVAQRDLGANLVGKYVYFAHRPAGVEAARVLRVTVDGLVELEGWAGGFAPHLFVLADGAAPAAPSSP